MSGDMPDLPEMPEGDDPKGLRAWADNVAKQNRALREAGQSAAQELASMKRAQAFDQAGVPNEGWGLFFRDKFDGEADPDAIKSAIETYGFAQPVAAPAPETQAAPEAVNPINAELAAMAQQQEVRATFAQPSGQASALIEAMGSAKSMAELESLTREAGILSSSD